MHKEVILFLAKQAIKDSFEYTKSIDIQTLVSKYPYLAKDKASFVTLKLDGKLRGCIGSLVAQRPLIEDIIYNANAAAFRDSRFSKLTKEEFEKVDIEVSVLSEPVEVLYKDVADLKTKIKPNIDGVILKLNSHQATFLPQVWQELPEFESFFAHLLQKANLSMDSFKNHPSIYKYQVQKF